MNPIATHLKQILQSLHDERRLIAAQLNAATEQSDIERAQRQFIRVLANIIDLDDKILAASTRGTA